MAGLDPDRVGRLAMSHLARINIVQGSVPIPRGISLTCSPNIFAESSPQPSGRTETLQGPGAGVGEELAPSGPGATFVIPCTEKHAAGACALTARGVPQLQAWPIMALAEAALGLACRLPLGEA